MKTTDKTVKEEMQEHVLSYFTKEHGWEDDDQLKNLKEQLKSFDYMFTTYDKGKYMAESGSFLIYYDDQRKFIENLLGQKDTESMYSDSKVFETYVYLIARTIDELVKGI